MIIVSFQNGSLGDYIFPNISVNANVLQFIRAPEKNHLPTAVPD